MTVIKPDFGIEKRHTARRLRKLLSLDALHEANVRANPLPYLERASERIDQLEKVLFEAAAAGRPPPAGAKAAERIEIDRAEYECLLNCRSIVDRSLAALEVAESEKDDGRA